ncbi:MAG: nucleotidyltransferase family protein, partial [Acidobacteriota bacterium]|nr:nucleotidyltransferase family protein [Acidobacteriota bacterium]
ASNDLPAASRDRFRRALVRSTATALMYEGVARELSTIAGKARIPLVFLKGFALFLLEIGPAGSRPFGDLDALAPRSEAERLLNRLLDAGYELRSEASTEQHLPIVVSPQGGAVEIHFALRGLGGAGHRGSTFGELERRGELTKLAQYPGESFVPTPQALATHALVHGMRQHLLRPHTYPLFRMVGDLVDLLPRPAHWDHIEHRLGGDERFISHRTLLAVRSLSTMLAEGELPRPDDPSGSGRLLAHLIAGSLDDEYAASLGTSHLRQRLTEARRSGELLAYLRRKLIVPHMHSSSEDTPRAQRSTIRRVGRGLLRQARAVHSRVRLRRRHIAASPAESDDPIELGRHED